MKSSYATPLNPGHPRASIKPSTVQSEPLAELVMIATTVSVVAAKASGPVAIRALVRPTGSAP